MTSSLPALPIAVGFGVGAIPFSNIAARGRAGVDLRTVGSGTVSGSGLYEVAGKGPLFVVGLFELAKGALGALLAGRDHPVAGRWPAQLPWPAQPVPVPEGRRWAWDLAGYRSSAGYCPGGRGAAAGRVGVRENGRPDGPGFFHRRPAPSPRGRWCSWPQGGRRRRRRARADIRPKGCWATPHRPGRSPRSIFTGWSSTATRGEIRVELPVIGPFVIGPFVIGPFVIGPFVVGPFVSPSPDGPTGGHKLSVGVVTDSASSLPSDLAAASGVIVVPMWVAIGGQQFRDGGAQPGRGAGASRGGAEHFRAGPG